LLEIALRDQSFYATSDGGVTFSGGEPLLHIDFLAHTANKFKRAGLHIAVETCGYFDFHEFKHKMLPWVDLILFDIKLIDPEQHKHFTGKSNRLILENFKRLCFEKNVEIRPRVPLVPGITTTHQNLRQTAALFSESGIIQYDMLPYNSSAQDKLKLLGLPFPAELPLAPLPLAAEMQLRKKFEQYIGNQEHMFCNSKYAPIPVRSQST
jgi:pyruvate formate lyase activating enzyme